MKLTRERKVLFAVLCVGGGALIVDRALLDEGHSAPQSAAAHQSAAEAHVADAMSEETAGIMRATVALLSDAAEEPMLNERLRDTATVHGASPLNPRDAFAPAMSWGEPGPSEPSDATAAEPAAPSPEQLAREFRDRRQLNAVMTDRGVGIAIVNGRAVRVGQRLERYTLQRVGHRTAVFSDGVLTIELKVSER